MNTSMRNAHRWAVGGILLASIALSSVAFAQNTASFFDKSFYTKTPWATLHKNELQQLLKSNIKTPYTLLNWNRTALLIIDTQNDWGTARGSAPETDIGQVVPNIVKLTNEWRKTGLPIIHIVRMYKKNGGDADNARRWQMQTGAMKMAVPGSWGSQLVKATNPSGAKLKYKLLLSGGIQQIGKNEYVIYKPHYNGFLDTPLDTFLKMKHINSVVFIGMTFPNCVRATQYGATDHHYRVAAVPNALTQVYKGGLIAMQRQGVQLMSMQGFKKLVADVRVNGN